MKNIKQCNICPRNCNVDREKTMGYCNNTDKIKIARADLHFWEEPPISGEEGSGTVFFSGCNLRCIFCQNYKISTDNNGYYITTEELSNIFLELQQKGANNINLVTPTHFILQIADAIKSAKEKGMNLPIVYNTSGYEKVESLKLLEGLVDVYLPDFKYFDYVYAKEYSKAEDYPEICKMAIAEMVRQVGKPEFDEKGIMKKGVIVRHLMLPGLINDSKNIIKYLYNTYHDDIWISIMNQYTPLERVKSIKRLSRKVSPKEYESLINYAISLGVENAFIQEEGTVSESFIPKFFEEK